MRSTSRRRRCSAWTPARREGILQTVKLARELGASTAVLSAPDVAQALVAHAREHNLSKLVLGQQWPNGPGGSGARSARRLASLAPDIDRIEVGAAAAHADVAGVAPPARTCDDERRAAGTRGCGRYGLAAAACVADHAAGARRWCRTSTWPTS